MNKVQHKQLMDKYRLSFQHMYSESEAKAEALSINDWLKAMHIDEVCNTVSSIYGYHILMSDSEFLTRTG